MSVVSSVSLSQSFFSLEFQVKQQLVLPGKVVLSTCFGEDYLFLVKITFFCNLFHRNETEMCTYL